MGSQVISGILYFGGLVGSFCLSIHFTGGSRFFGIRAAAGSERRVERETPHHEMRDARRAVLRLDSSHLTASRDARRAKGRKLRAFAKTWLQFEMRFAAIAGWPATCDKWTSVTFLAKDFLLEKAR